MGKAKIGLQAAAVASAAALTLAACGGGSSGSGGSSGGGGGASGKPAKGGTLTFLTSSEKLQHLDPQVIYTGEDAAAANGYWNRNLAQYKTTPDAKKSLELVGDAATDAGKASKDGKTWTFTIRTGMKWSNGSPVTCEDFKYGISRTFATDVISGGPTYAIQQLDIPQDPKGGSVYKGPYVKNNNQAAYDKAVQCNGQTLTFHLSAPASDWNYATTWGMGAVPKSADTGAKYDLAPLTNGPYTFKLGSNKQAQNSDNLTLVRDKNWDPKTDPNGLHPAYPDSVVWKFSVQNTEQDQRLIQDSGADQSAAQRDNVQPANLATVFNDDNYKNRRVNDFDPYTDYYAIRTDKIKNVKIRQAIAVAMDRAQLRTVMGGQYGGDLADGVVKPNLPTDYAPSGMWTDMFGQKIPDSGDPAFAKKLIQESGQPAPSITLNYNNATPTASKRAGVIKESLAKAGIDVTLKPLPRGDFYTIVFDPQKAADIIDLGWGPDWPNAVTVLPQLFSPTGAWNLSQNNDPTFTKKAAAATKELDRAKQAQEWKDLNKYAMKNVFAVPYLFQKQQRIAGSKVHSASGENGNVYIWPPAGSWPYPDMYVSQ